MTTEVKLILDKNSIEEPQDIDKRIEKAMKKLGFVVEEQDEYQDTYEVTYKFEGQHKVASSHSLNKEVDKYEGNKD